MTQIDDATERFLEAAAADLAARLGRTGTVEALVIESPAVTIVASVRIAGRTFRLTGSGASLIDAYAHLERPSAEDVLAVTYTRVLGDLLDTPMR